MTAAVASDVIVVGSQSILGTYDESELPAAATMSLEVDILPIADDNAETGRLADLIEGVAASLAPLAGGAVLAAVTPTLLSALVGVVAGLLLVLAMTLVGKLTPAKQ